MMPRVTLCMRPGCHLCEDAAALLRRLGCEVDEINIEEDAELLLKYDQSVPVMLAGGNVLLSGIIREREARVALRQYARSARRNAEPLTAQRECARGDRHR